MDEHLIRTRDAHDWPGVHRDRLVAVLVPPGDGWVVVDGPGDLRVRRGAAEIAFTGDDPGWHVVAVGDLPDLETVLDAVTARVAAEVGEPCEWVSLG